MFLSGDPAMGNDVLLTLPDLIELGEFQGNFHQYLEAVYQFFKQDFIDNQPNFRGVRLGLKKHPLSQGKEATFWHMVSEGDDEANREPDFRRMERIKWPAVLINNSEYSCLKVWENTRTGNKTNILIFHENEEYLVVLRRGNGYLLPWTAYMVTEKPRKRKLLKEYQDYIKKQGATQSIAPVPPSTHGC